MPYPPRKRPFRSDGPEFRKGGPPFRRKEGGKPGPAHGTGHGPRPAPAAAGGPRDKGWDPVAAWYDKLVGAEGSDYHRNVILPAAMEMLKPGKGDRILDLCCGQGVLIPPLLDAGAEVTGVDASPRLIDAAKQRIGLRRGLRLLVADATAPGPWTDGTHSGAACLMAVHDVADAAALFRNLSAALQPGGRAVIVFMHPCFRIPRQSHWGWDEERKIQYRRLDLYASPLTIPITTHPGRGGGPETQFHHRSLADVLTNLGTAGLAVTECRELCTHRRSQPGPRSRAEHRAAAEFPVFIALKAVKLPVSAPAVQA